MMPSTIRTGHALRSAIAHGDHTPKIVHCSQRLQGRGRGSGSRPKPFENHLIRVAGGALALLRRAHGPGQQRQAEDVAGDPGRRRRQLVDPIGDEMRPGAERVAEMQHAPALGRRRLRPVGCVYSCVRR